VKVYKSSRRLLMEKASWRLDRQQFQEAVGLLKIMKVYKSFRRVLREGPPAYYGLQVVQEAAKGTGILKIMKVYKSLRMLLRDKASRRLWFTRQALQEGVDGNGLLNIVVHKSLRRLLRETTSWRLGSTIRSGGCWGKKHPEDYGPQVFQAAVKGKGILNIMVYKSFRRLLRENASWRLWRFTHRSAGLLKLMKVYKSFMRLLKETASWRLWSTGRSKGKSVLKIVKVYKSVRKLLLEKASWRLWSTSLSGGCRPPEDYGLVQEAVMSVCVCVCVGVCVSVSVEHCGLQIIQDAIKGNGLLKITVCNSFRRLLREKASWRIWSTSRSGGC
jgi:ASC-1-like (ASCH) protein